MLPEHYAGPRCGNCGAHFSPGEVICSVCGAHRYGPGAPIVGPLARRSAGQMVQEYFWWVVAGAGLVICSVLGIVFGFFDFLLHLIPH
jgi:hypothetical protein